MDVDKIIQRIASSDQVAPVQRQTSAEEQDEALVKQVFGVRSFMASACTALTYVYAAQEKIKRIEVLHDDDETQADQAPAEAAVCICYITRDALTTDTSHHHQRGRTATEAESGQDSAHGAVKRKKTDAPWNKSVGKMPLVKGSLVRPTSATTPTATTPSAASAATTTKTTPTPTTATAAAPAKAMLSLLGEYGSGSESE